MATILVRVLALVCLVLVAGVSLARDMTGLSDVLPPELRLWISKLSTPSGGVCCDQADGFDPVWRVTLESPTGFQVLIGDEWVDVMPGHVVTEMNRIGVARVWLESDLMGGRKKVRCFMPGPMD